MFKIWLLKLKLLFKSKQEKEKLMLKNIKQIVTRSRRIDPDIIIATGVNQLLFLMDKNFNIICMVHLYLDYSRNKIFKDSRTYF